MSTQGVPKLEGTLTYTNGEGCALLGGPRELEQDGAV
jgi:hypothetical protein